jgi:hypothetical protein
MDNNAYCTLFDARYFSRGVAMCESLRRHAPSARIYLFAFDEVCERAAAALGLPGLTVVPLRDLEDDALRAAQQNRSWVEYLWTCTPATIGHVMDSFGEDVCTYVDADLYFFASPESLHAELQGHELLITEHRYSPGLDSTATSGIYNVQFMPFRNTARGRTVLEWWRKACLESCELNPAEGKCGDQKYLDDWPTRFGGVKILEHLGGGVAPWNVQQYKFEERDDRVLGKEIATGKEFELVFYHFHAFKVTEQGMVRLTNPGYPLGADVVELIYRPYVRHLLDVGERVRAARLEFDPHGLLAEPALGLRSRIGQAARSALSYLKGDLAQQGNNAYRLRDLAR